MNGNQADNEEVNYDIPQLFLAFCDRCISGDIVLVRSF